ncbi:MAG: hypothetical protein EA351_00675 [Gemmatimonadales bacterium]|nr:MAG: hypothetical protein EA351_00675 [Gemmatimonadales bacterium]
MTRFSKREMKLLRAAAGTSWERELDAALDRLFEHFQEWKRGGIDAFELSERIHRFHDGNARDLYKFYTGAKPPIAAGYGVARGWIGTADLPRELLEKLEPTIAFYREEELDDDEVNLSDET